MAVHITRAGVALTVGIIVLTGLLIGGLLWMKETGEQARRDEAIAIAEQNLDAETDDIVLNDGTVQNEATGEGAGQASDQPANEGTTPQSSDSDEATEAADMPQGSTVEELPQTGPGDGLTVILAGLAVYGGVMYYQSRHTSRITR